MKHALPTIGIVLGLIVTPALADPWKDESGKGRWGYDHGPYRAYNYDREYKQEYYRGPCKIERKWQARRLQRRDEVQGLSRLTAERWKRPSL